MSPSRFNSNGASVFYVEPFGNPGVIGNDNVSDSHVVRPVISLKSNVVVTREDGSGTNSYTLSL